MKLTSNEPFWLIKNGIIQTYPSLREHTKTDMLVVGAGITGALIAHQCVAEGYDTILIDKREVARGSTSATTSMLQYEIDTPLHTLSQLIGEDAAERRLRACHDSIDTLQKISRHIKSDAGFAMKDSLYYAAFKKDIPELEIEFNARKKAGFDVRWLDESDLLEKYHLHHAHAGILSAQGASMDAFQMAHDLMHFNCKKGLRVFDKTEITHVKYGSRKVVASTEFGHEITARKIIYCTGYEAAAIIPEKIVNLLSTYAVVSEIQSMHPVNLRDTLFWNTASPYHYIRSTDDSRILIGGEDEDFLDTAKRDALLDKKTNKLLKYFEKILPETNFLPDFSWAGTFGETKDGLPYIGTHKAFPSAYFVLGFGGNGITFSVIGMEMLSCYLKGKKHPLEKEFGFGR